MRTDIKVVLNHLPGNARDVGCLPCKHVDICPQEGDERAFLFAVKGEAYGKSPAHAILLDGHLLGFRRGHLILLALAGRSLWHVLSGHTILRRCVFAGVIAGTLARARSLAGGRGLTGLLLGGRSRCLGGRCCNRLLIELISADECILLITAGGDDAHRARHLQLVVCVVRRRHEPGQRRAAKDPVVWQWDLKDIENDPLRLVVEVATKCNG